MFEKYKNIIEYIEKWDSNKSLSDIQNLKVFIEGLQNEILKLSTIPNSHHGIKQEIHSHNDTIVTYCGVTEQEGYYKVLEKIYKNDLGYYIMSHTEMGEFLNLDSKDGLQGALMNLLKKDPAFENFGDKSLLRGLLVLK